MESDSMTDVNAIVNNDRTPNGNYALICNVRKLLQRKWFVSIHHVYRETNQAANFMASFAVGLVIGCHVFDTARAGLNAILFDDYKGVALDRPVVI